jgi:hypothetical protein
VLSVNKEEEIKKYKLNQYNKKQQKFNQLKEKENNKKEDQGEKVK